MCRGQLFQCQERADYLFSEALSLLFYIKLSQYKVFTQLTVVVVQSPVESN